MKKYLILAFSLLFCIVIIALVALFLQKSLDSALNNDSSSIDSSSSTILESSSSSSEDTSSSSEVTTNSSIDEVSSSTETATTPQNPSHTHSYGEWKIVTAPTCISNGYQIQTCSCGDYRGESVAPTGLHTYENEKCKHCGALPPWSVGLEYGFDTLSGATVRTVTGIGSCSDTSIVIPNFIDGFAVKIISDGAFENCDSITKITIPKEMTEIRESFESCPMLEQIDVDKNNPAYKSIDGNLYTKDGETLVRFMPKSSITSFNIPINVMMIDKDAFLNCSSLKNVSIPDGVSNMVPFKGCDSLEKITIGKGVRDINVDAVRYCTNLKIVNITDVASWCNISSLPNDFFSNGVKLYLNDELLTDLVIPDTVTSIAWYAFKNCNSIQSVTIPDSVESIGVEAFNDCDAIESITLGKNIKTIGSKAFKSCISLEEIVLPTGITSFGWYVFMDCNNLSIYLDGPSVPDGWDAYWNYATGTKNCPVYCYSETEPTSDGNYWHYNRNGNIVVW